MTFILSFSCLWLSSLASNTKLSIDGTNFHINGKITYESASNNNVPGLLLNSRMIQGVFDDYNQSNVDIFAYPDTGEWDPDRNTNEFIGNMSLWYSYGLLAFTVGLQGGGPVPQPYPNPQPWIVSAFNFDTGALDSKYTDRLYNILKEADRLAMVPVFNLFYSPQARRYNDNNDAINASITNILDWLISHNSNHLLIDVANECDHSSFSNTILHCSDNMTTTIQWMKEYFKQKTGQSNTDFGIFFSSSTNNPPSNDLIGAADFVLMHGNGKSPSDMQDMIDQVRNSANYKSNPKPIVFNEDPDTDFNDATNNMETAVNNHCSWGYYDQGSNDYQDGYQSPPTAWDVNTSKKESFFNQVKMYTS